MYFVRWCQLSFKQAVLIYFLTSNIRDCQFPNIISETPTGVRKNGLLICSCQFLLSWIIFSYLISQLQYFQEIASWYCFQFKVCSATSNWKWTMSLVKNKVGIFLFFIWFPCFVLTKKSVGGLSTRSNRLEQLSCRQGPGHFPSSCPVSLACSPLYRHGAAVSLRTSCPPSRMEEEKKQRSRPVQVKSLPFTCACVLSHLWLFVTPWTVALQAPLSMDYPGKNTRVGCHFLLQGAYLTQESNLCIQHLLAGGFFTTEPPEKPVPLLETCNFHLSLGLNITLKLCILRII